MENQALSDDETVTSTEVFQLGYASAATHPYSTDDLKDLLAKARSNNARLGITGVLLYHDGSFLQVLEGEKDAVESLYEKISQDPNHTNAMLLFRDTAPERCFDQWTMGFRHLRKEDAKRLPGLNLFMEYGVTGLSGDDGAKLKRILFAFREGKWHRSIDS